MIPEAAVALIIFLNLFIVVAWDIWNTRCQASKFMQ